MSIIRTTAVIALCTMLAACTGAGSDTTAPAMPGGPALDVTVPEQELLPSGDESTGEGQQVGLFNHIMATGGRASGHFELAAPFLSIVSERYSFTSHTTTFPGADGQLEVHALQRNGVEFVVHSTVECMSIVGNQAWMAGRATKVTINNKTRPDLEGITTAWRVEDNGEGANSPPDRASLVFFRSNPQLHCQNRPPIPMTPSATGNIQVRAR